MQFHRIFKQLRRALSNPRPMILTSTRRPRSTVGALLLGCLLLAVSACASEPDSASLEAPDAGDPWLLAEPDADAEWLPILATQDLAVGVNRIAFSLDGLDPGEQPPTVRVSLYALDEDRETPRSVQYARFIAYDGGDPIAAHGHANASVSDRALPIGRGVYVAPLRLTAPGLWGVLLEMSSDAARESVRLRFSVRERPAAPRVGERAPSVDSRTRDDVAALSQLTSDSDPEPALYALSIAEALALRRPLVIAFATPAFCHSRTCAPVLDAVKAVWREFSAQLSAIHVEVFENPDEPSRLVESTAFRAWRLPSEPWVFVIDGAGVIRYVFEGAVTESELRSAVEWVIQDDG